MIDVNCVPCFQKQAARLFEKYNIPEKRREVLSERFNDFLSKDGFDKPSPLSVQFLNVLMKKETGIEDLYLKEKSFYNKLLMERYQAMKGDVESSDNPAMIALKYALAGNIIDFGPPRRFDIEKTFSEALEKKIAVNDSDALFKAIRNAGTVLYLGDNAGEIVTDKLFIETLTHPGVIFAVRGGPVLNDVTYADAEEVGMQEVATVIENGFDAPSTLPEYCSDEFRDIFNSADVVISKGQGNFEGLYGQVKKKNIFFLFMVKCEGIARVTGRNVGDAVIMKGAWQS
ncbi:MAG: damage-control phosphatase, subfamily [Anaerophaga sp.]|uniref:damage-control phosphatase ARMT1 family protein n=1 Tax=Anaerophaga thermohalophila TaxID=177400 RepID=UPI000237C430|nr:ARMT1-like domain-containing protein [Anaerophaga thermohalophila]MDK2841459.1 damage-control phosphatase, subfamily [Anaerophaga sp.]MDN5290719.1 damage-control phosphatase, subfamily [Anaerophaga sp.]